MVDDDGARRDIDKATGLECGRRGQSERVRPAAEGDEEQNR
jgi:hypothetical protein